MPHRPTLLSAVAATPEVVAGRLLTATHKRWYDPAEEIDWETPEVDGLYYMPPEQVSLYGTPLWARMSDQQRIDLSRHEVSSVAQCGIWLEMILNGLLLRQAYWQDARSSRFQYALTEIADECRHSVMFADVADKLETPRYGPRMWAKVLGGTVPRVIPPAEAFGSILIAEEILDAGQRLLMRDERVQPFMRQVCSLHVAEESRHIGYARSEFARIVQGMPRVRKEFAIGYLGATGLITLENLVHPQVYAEVGLDIGTARRTVRHSPHRKEIVQAWTTRFSGFLKDVGLSDGPTGRVWRSIGLL